MQNSADFDVTSFYWQTIKLKGITFTIDKNGYVMSDELWELWHLEDCFEEGMNLHNLFQVLDKMDKP